ncbi:MAG: universal stress protein [Alphaproteobacteria bacterium]|nr:universal stress protein [Alphaproteobacteria bacterium]
MYTHLIWLTDLSDNAARCRGPVLALARALKAEVSVVHALGGLDALEARFRKQVAAVARDLVDQGVAAHGLVPRGHLEEFVATCTHDGELLIVGRTGVSGLDRVIVGANTTRVLRNAHAPVLVVGGEAPSDTLFSVLCPVELDPDAPSAVTQAVMLARALAAHITFLHVQSIGDADPPEQRLARLREHVRTTLSVEQQANLEARYEVGLGEDAAHAIGQLARKHDLIVMASRGRSGLARWVLGSVTESVVAQAPAPVLVVRA